MLLYIVANIFMVLTWALAVCSFGNRGRNRLLLVMLFCCAQIIATSLLLGMLLRNLTRLNLFYLNIALSALLLVLCIVACVIKKASPFKNIAKLSIHWFNAFIAKKPFYIWTVMLVSSIALCFHTILGIIFPDQSFDSVWYHLPFVGHVISNGYIDNFTNISIWSNCYPMNTELIYIWNVIFIEKDFLVNISQVFFLLMGILATSSLIRMFTGSKNLKWMSLLIILFPLVSTQLTTCYIDVSLSSMLMAAVYFLARLFRRFNYADTFFCSLSLSIVLGMKYSGVYYVAVFLAAAALYFLFRRFSNYTLPCEWEFLKYFGIGDSQNLFKWRTSGARLPLAALIFLFCLAVWGSPFYVENYLYFKNPIYPQEFCIMGRTIFKGENLSAMLPAKISYSSSILESFKKYTPGWNSKVFTLDTSFLYDPVFVVVILPSILCYAAFGIYMMVKRKNARHLLFNALFFVLLAATPGNTISRYLIFMIFFGIIALCVFIKSTEGLKNPVTVFFLTILTLFNFFISTSHTSYTPEKIADVVKCPRIVNSKEFGAFVFSTSAINSKIGSHIFENYENETFSIIGIEDSYEIWANDFSRHNKINRLDKNVDTPSGKYLVVSESLIKESWLKDYQKLYVLPDTDLWFLKRKN